MYLVFPLFVLIISTCCGLYFCDRCRKHLKKKKAEERKKENELLENQEENEENKASTSNSVDGHSSDLNKSAKDNGVANSPIALEMSGDINRNDTPLEDVENSPEVKAVNAVPIKHRETSFMTDGLPEESNNNNSDQQPVVIKPLPTTREIQVKNIQRRDSFKSTSTVRSNKSLDRKSNGTRSSAAFHEKTTLPDVTKRYSKMDRKFTALSAEAIGEILQYYKDKKHMPDIIPERR
ncbi:unnamed protein product [Mytilus edulis]|uniref:Uncharacterized protein n=1 Tax=Mytilus edulis TaxID=6550 RepID=A0A8S3R1D4_MYTED|nr:unnamed protein product [Mytilus edulis]